MRYSFFRLVILLPLMVCFGCLMAQLPHFDTIRLSRISLFQDIGPETGIFMDTLQAAEMENKVMPAAFTAIPYSMGRKLEARYVAKTCYLRFSIFNDLDTALSMYFLPGFYCHSIQLYKANAVTGTYELLPEEKSPQTRWPKAVRRLPLDKGEKAIFLTELRFIKTTVNTLTPTLCYDYALPTLFNQLQNERKLNSIITYLVCGIMLMMILYSIGGYYANRNPEFIYYACYAFLLGLLFFFKAFLYKLPIAPNFFFESYLDFILQATGTIFYLEFLRTFINSRKDFPLLDNILFAQLVGTIAGMIFFTFLHFFTDNFPLQNLVENLIKYSWSFSTVIFIGFAILRKNIIFHYLAVGHIFLVLFGFFSLYLINSPNRFSAMLTSLVNDSLFWYELGIVFELVFFMIALSIKNKQNITSRVRENERMLLDYEKSVIERKMAILAAQQEERNRISADMHDELGSGVTAIRLLSELAKAKMKENTLPEIEKISNSANDLIGKMNTIIWTMKSSNDSADNLVAYVRAYAAEFFDNTNIQFRVDYPEYIPAIELSGEKRRNIFLCIKEALNNIVKHALASKASISFAFGREITIRISDNGVGINPEKTQAFSNGLVNMRKRMENIDGRFQLSFENGTVVTLFIPFE